MKHHWTRIGACLALCITTASVPGLAEAQSTPSDIEVVKQDLEGVKKELVEIKKALAEMRQLMTQRAAASPQAAPATVKLSVGQGPNLGSPDAPVTLVEFSDYQCPFCQRYVSNTFSELKKDYIDTGKVRYVFRDFPLESIHPQARKAAEAAHCAGDQGKYWEMHDTLFKDQRALAVDGLKNSASTLGLKQDEFDLCLDQGKYAKAVSDDEAAGLTIGVN